MNLKSSSPYIIVFHEDDIAHPEYLTIAHKALMKFPEASLFCSNMSFFENSAEIKFDKIAGNCVRFISDPKLFVEIILKGAPISFTSCIYSKRKLNTNFFELDRYSMLADRPYIIKNLINNGFILFSESNLIAAQNHASTGDSRWRDLKTKHIFNISTFYKSFFNKNYNYDRFILKKYLTQRVLEYYYLLEPDLRPNLLSFLTVNMIKNNLSLPYLLLLNNTIRSIKKAFSYKLR